MTSYSVVAPVILARFQGPVHVFYQAWSPRRYGPAYQFDLIIEGEDNQHPMMNMEYVDFLHRVTDRLNLEQGEHPFVDMTTDFHSTVPLDERGETCFVIVMKDTIFSPVFFLREDIDLYFRFLESEFVTLRSHFQILEISHTTI